MAPIKIDSKRTSQKLLVGARRHLAEGDLLQASEKGWGAAAQMVKSVAEARGWPHKSHHHLWRTISRLAKETGDAGIQTGFASASALHTNFYEGWMVVGNVVRYLDQVEDLLLKLESLN
ncbi:MAG: PaREP1 family protein [bacterium]|nr:PaREP1 family protein [bacterium]